MKVKSVRRVALQEPVPVYDIEVPDNHNFKLAVGPFVHNSKDLSDALAGVIYGLSMRREIWVMHGISIREIPQSIQAAVQQTKQQIKDR